jgi:biopolymer transport protein ExbD
MVFQRRVSKKSRLSIAPLLDMIFILLIFFVVSTTFSQLPGVVIQAPEATTPDTLSPQTLTIGITSQGVYVYDQQTLSMDQLRGILANHYAQNTQQRVLIMADKRTALQHVIGVMDMCKAIGIQQVAIAENRIE